MTLAEIEKAAFKWTVLLAIVLISSVVLWGFFHPQRPATVVAPGGTATTVQASPPPIPLAIPGVTLNTGVSPELLTSLLSALLHGQTRTQVAANTTVSSLATPRPVSYEPVRGSSLTKADQQVIYGLAYGASYNASVEYGKTQHINTQVTITQVPVAPSRFGAGVALVGRNQGGALLQYNLPLSQNVSLAAGAIVGSKVSPAFGINYRINGFRAGPCYDLFTRRLGACLTYSI